MGTDTVLERSLGDGSLRGAPRAPDDQPPPGPLRQLLRLARPVRGRLATAFGLGALSAVARVVGLAALADLVAVIVGGVVTPEQVWWRVTGALVAVVVAGGTKSLASSVSHHAAFEHEVIVRRQLAEHLGRLPLGVVQGWGSGHMKKVVQDDVRGLHAAVADTPALVGAYLVGPPAALVAMFWFEWRLALVVLGLVPLIGVVMAIAMRDYDTQRRAYDAAHEAVQGAAVEYVHGMAEVRTFDAGSASFSRFETRVRAFSDQLRSWSHATRWGSLTVRLVISPLPAIALVALVGGTMLLAGWVSVPAMVAVLLLSPLPFEAVLPLMWMNEYLHRSKAAAVRITEVLEEPALPEPHAPSSPASGEVVLRGVKFAYDRQRGPALSGVDLVVPDGTVCALVGASGSGKSTLARLVPRFYDVDAGAVLVGGVDVREMDPRVLLRHVAIVFQEPMLLSATVRDNLTIGHPDATAEEIEAAARAAQAH
jgi:ATP-binding cassette, subfamily B, bacterial IrtA/YbtP